jgi:hypothetical protein
MKTKLEKLEKLAGGQNRAAELIFVSPRTFRRYKKNGKIPAPTLALIDYVILQLSVVVNSNEKLNVH